MKILIVGLGSMGKRRIRLLKNLDGSAEIIGVDTRAERRRQAEEMGCKVYADLSRAIAEKPYAAFVCTGPLSHRDITRQLLDGKVHVFTELNLVNDRYRELMQKAAENNVTLFLSSTMLYRGEINYMMNRVKNFDGQVGYIYHIGQYLPDWHPWENYQNFFVSDSRSNGCRELFGIELPWIIETFGKVKEVYSTSCKITDLNLSFPDTFFVTMTHESGVKGVLAIDLVCAKAVRNLEIFGEGMHLFWEGNPKALYDFDNVTKEKKFVNTYETFEHDPRYSDNIVENAYVDEMKNFFAVIKGEEEPRYSYEKDLYTISLMDRIEGIEK